MCDPAEFLASCGVRNPGCLVVRSSQYALPVRKELNRANGSAMIDPPEGRPAFDVEYLRRILVANGQHTAPVGAEDCLRHLALVIQLSDGIASTCVGHERRPISSCHVQ